MESENAQSLSEQLRKAESIAEFEQNMLKFCELAELEYYLFASIKATSLNSPDIFVLSNYPTQWYKGYFADDLKKHDPVVRYCVDCSSPVVWSTLEKSEKYCSPQGHQLLQNSREAGLVDGVSVPIKAPSGEVGIFSLSTGSNEHLQERLTDVLPWAMYYSHIAFETYLRLQIESSEMKPLTPKEKESLFWACEGKTAWETSQIMTISERTVNFHMSSVIEKLCAVNRQHAIAKAIMNGLVKPLQRPN